MLLHRSVRWLVAILLIPSSVASILVGSSASSQQNLRRSLQSDAVGDMGDRVGEIDRTDAQCILGNNGATGPIEWTEINFYYAIHASSAIDQMKERELELSMFTLIETAILWCTMSGTPGVPVEPTGGNRRMQEILSSDKFEGFARRHRKLTREDARRMSIIAFNNNPEDKDIDFEFNTTTTPCQFSTSTVCSVMEGRMSITAHASDNLVLIVASILDALQDIMYFDLLPEAVCDDDEDPCIVEKVEYWGDSLEHVLDNVDDILFPPVLPSDDADDDGGGGALPPNGILPPDGQEDDDRPIFLFAAVPLAALLAFALLLARNKRKLQVMTADDLANIPEDYILPGTGDPPRSFHEGMYHYTRSGARYLSTNCEDCYNTRKMGNLSSVQDLPTINERHLYDPASAMSYSFDESSTGTEMENSEHDPSAHRKMYFVEPSTGSLGQKGSTVDVHSCTSATCSICCYKPRDVAFLETPSLLGKSPNAADDVSSDDTSSGLFDGFSSKYYGQVKDGGDMLLVGHGSI